MKKRNVAAISLGILAMGLCSVTANAKSADMVITADTYIADFGQTVRRLRRKMTVFLTGKLY